jgi:hypothetical protein
MRPRTAFGSRRIALSAAGRTMTCYAISSNSPSLSRLVERNSAYLSTQVFFTPLASDLGIFLISLRARQLLVPPPRHDDKLIFADFESRQVHQIIVTAVAAISISDRVRQSPAIAVRASRAVFFSGGPAGPRCDRRTFRDTASTVRGTSAKRERQFP